MGSRAPHPASSLAAYAGRIEQEAHAIARAVAERVRDPKSLADRELGSSIELLLDRCATSMRLAKPVGLASWAVREGERIGAARAMELLEAATEVLSAHDERAAQFFQEVRIQVRSVLWAGCESVEEPQPSVEALTALALLAMAAERNPAEAVHAQAVAEWSRRLGGSLRMTFDQVEGLRLAALLPDIGKSAVPRDLLMKEGALNEREWVTIRDHAAAGARIVAQIPCLARYAHIVRAHHERWDGGGYPDGLRGDGIPLESRVIGVADAFHAMISERPYRRALTPRNALRALEAERGSQWDPEILNALRGLFEGTAERQAVSTA